VVTTPSQPKPLKLRFSVFEVDFASRELFKGGMRLKVQKQPFTVLCTLLERAGEVVSREELRELLWPDNTFVEYEDSLNTAVRKLRAALSDSSDFPRYIETVARQGYRFIAPVEAVSVQVTEVADVKEGSRNERIAVAPAAPEHIGADASPARSEQVPVRPQQTGRTTRSRRMKSLLVLASVLGLVLIAALVGYSRWSGSRTQPQVASGRTMLAVLPFENLTGDPSQEYFSDGLTEEMISQLGNLDSLHLGVIARTSVMRYKNSQAPLDQVGRELGVQYVIEGSVRRDSNNVRVTAQLIQTRDQTHVWAREYDRELKGLLVLQGEIAEEIANEIQLTLDGHKPAVAQASRSPRQYEAYDLYLKGQYFFNKRTGTGFEEAISYFQQATAKDPNYARAYAGLADCYALMGGYSERPQVEFISKARAAALKALEIDQNLPEAHTALALIVQNYDWDWQTAEKEFRRAIELNPNYATAHHWYAEHLMWRGRFDEALQESERARQLDPLSLIIAADNGAVLYFSRQYDRAIEKWRSVLEMDNDFPRAHLIVGAYAEKGMFGAALADNEKFRPVTPVSSYWSWRAYIYGRSGKEAQARHALRELLQSNRSHPVDAMIVAWGYRGVGDKDKALAWLEKAYAEHSIELVSMKVNPGYDLLRGDPRFQDLLKRVGLAD
jgi:TolB-like protein/DNA-binding winged helix-turn-helix (wHTH) protein/Tfp pilus assembly protein PilF